MRIRREVARSGQRLDFILDRCRGRRVLHLGCSDAPFTAQRLREGTLLHALIEPIASAQYGVDIDEEGVHMLREAGYLHVEVVDVENLVERSPFGDTQFEVIVAGEILEHLPSPGLFLANIRQIMEKDGAELVVTTINAMGAYRILYEVLTGRENVHADHVAYYSRSTLTKLLEIHGLRVGDFSFYPIGREHEQGVKQGKRWALWLADRLAYHLAPSLGDGVMARCTLSHCDDDRER